MYNYFTFYNWYISLFPDNKQNEYKIGKAGLQHTHHSFNSEQHRQYRSCFILTPFFFLLTVFLHYMAASIKDNVEIGNQYMLLL